MALQAGLRFSRIVLAGEFEVKQNAHGSRRKAWRLGCGLPMLRAGTG
jgi:hypothetical protein